MRPGLKLSHKLFLLVAVPLAFELGFVAVLNNLLEEAEHEREREAQARAIIARVNEVHRIAFTAITDIASFRVLGSDDAEERHVVSLRESFEREVPELERLVKDKPVEYAHFQRARALVELGAEQLRQIKHIIRRGGEMSLQDHLVTVKPLLRDLQRELDAILAEERKIEARSPIKQAEQRGRVKKILLIGVVFNVVLAIMLVLYLSKEITSRLSVLMDNTLRLTRGQPLNPPISGNDELSHLDTVFKDMAGALAEEEQKIREAEARVRHILQSLPVGLVMLDSEGKIELANQTLSDMFSIPINELQGLKITTFLSGVSSDHQITLGFLVEKAMRHGFECLATIANPSMPIEITLREIEFPDGKRYIALILDITERREVERLKQDFVSMVSHDLKTPLTSIQNYMELLGQGIYGKLTKAGEDRLRALDKNVSRLIGLIRDLLDLDRIESGHLKLAINTFGLGTVMEQSMESVRALSETHKVRIEAPEIEMRISADRDRLIQVMVNLLSNAVKFSAPDSVVKVNVIEEEEQLRFEVSDSGPGIPREFRASIFERFKQVSEEDSRKRGGAGLGLAISKAIVEQHGGEIGVDCRDGGGSTFWFTLPVRQAAEAVNRATS